MSLLPRGKFLKFALFCSIFLLFSTTFFDAGIFLDFTPDDNIFKN